MRRREDGDGDRILDRGGLNTPGADAAWDGLLTPTEPGVRAEL